MKTKLFTLALSGLAGLLSLVACAAPAATPTVPAPAVAPTVAVVLTSTALPPATATSAPTATSIPSATSTVVPTVAPTATSTRPAPTATRPVPTATHPAPTATRTSMPAPPAPTPIPGPAQACADLQARGAPGIYVVSITAEPELVWDSNPHVFKVGVCDTVPPPNTPAGKYKIQMSFPEGNRGLMSSSVSAATLNPGFNVVSVGPWVPGLENHKAICATRAVAETQVMYNDMPDPIFHPLVWPDGRDTVGLPIKCGGDYS